MGFYRYPRKRLKHNLMTRMEMYQMIEEGDNWLGVAVSGRGTQKS